MRETTEPGRPPSGRGGFSLIEVLVAMIILAVGLLALEGLAIGAARHVAVANQTTQYTNIAGERLETALDLARRGGIPTSSNDPLPNGTLVQTVVVPNAVGLDVLYDITVVVTPPATNNLNLQPVTLRGSYLQ